MPIGVGSVYGRKPAGVHMYGAAYIALTVYGTDQWISEDVPGKGAYTSPIRREKNSGGALFDGIPE